MSQPQSYTGACSCRKIQYRVDLEADAPVPKVLLCHCINCKHNTGSAFSTNFTVPRTALKFTTGEPRVFIDSSASGRPVNRGFCPDCGSPLTTQSSSAPEKVYIKWGTLDDEGRGRMQDLGGEIWCIRKDSFLEKLQDPGVQRTEN